MHSTNHWREPPRLHIVGGQDGCSRCSRLHHVGVLTGIWKGGKRLIAAIEKTGYATLDVRLIVRLDV